MRKIIVGIFILACFYLNGCVSTALVASVATDIGQDTRMSRIDKALIKNIKGVSFDIKQDNIARQTASIPGEKDIEAKHIYIATVKYIKYGSEADKAGLKIGDQIITLNGKPPSIWNPIIGAFMSEDESPVIMTILRNGNEYNIKMDPL